MITHEKPRLGPSPTKESTRRNERHILRLAHLAFPAIRVGRTTLILAQKDFIYYRLLPRQTFQPPWRETSSPYWISLPRTIDLPMRTWRYLGKHRALELTLAYDASEDTCVVIEGSVWLEHKFSLDKS